MTWPEVIVALGGQGAFLYAAAWLVKKLISEGMARDAERFKTRLKSDADAEVERLKNALQMTALEHEVRFSKLHERRAEVIVDLYRLLQEATSVTHLFTLQNPRDPAEEDRARQKVFELFQFINLNKLYLPSSVCSLLENFANKLNKIVIHVGVYMTHVEQPNVEMVTQQREVILAALSVLENDLPALKRELETEFRTMLGVPN